MIEQPLGFRGFHADANFNFQLNRWLPFLPEAALREAAAAISSFADWKRVMWELAERAEADSRLSEAAFYYRAAEFFMLSADPDKAIAYEKFLEIYNLVDWGLEYNRVEVPYEGAYLPALVVEAAGGPIDTLVVHGGFDSFAEELIHQVAHFSKIGFRVIMFEGPGQGYPLKMLGMPMVHDWERPVGAVLDHFEITECTLMGISLGGCLATRAAAREPRIKRVIADDVLEDFYGCLSNRMGARKAKFLGFLLACGAQGLVDRALERAAKADVVTAWAVDHGMHVSGTSSPYEYLKWCQRMNTRNVSPELTQDYLLLGAKDDHLVPLSQFYSQASTLSNVRSLTTRLFTASEHAGQHCHIGNQQLVNRVVSDWLTTVISGAQRA